MVTVLPGAVWTKQAVHALGNRNRDAVERLHTIQIGLVQILNREHGDLRREGLSDSQYGRLVEKVSGNGSP